MPPDNGVATAAAGAGGGSGKKGWSLNSFKDKFMKPGTGSGGGPQMSPAQLEAFKQAQREAAEASAAKLAAAIAESNKCERSNMLNMIKICIKTLVESSVGLATALNDDFSALKQLLVLLEKILSHGLKKSRMGVLGTQGVWRVVEALEKVHPESLELCQAIKARPDIKTSDGKARAWLRMAMQKKHLMDAFRILTTEASVTDSLYDRYGFMVCEEAQVVAGLIVCINIIECDFELDPVILDGPPPVIDLSLYLKDGNYLKPGTTREESSDERFSEHNFTVLQDQKMMLQEQFKTMEVRAGEFETLAEEKTAALEVFEDQVSSLQKQLDVFVEEKAASTAKVAAIEAHAADKVAQTAADMEIERSTYEKSREGLNDIYAALEKQVATEREMREQVESDLTKLVTSKKGADASLDESKNEVSRLQETIDGLRSQMKEVKDMNMMMLTNMQDAQGKIKSAELTSHKNETQVVQLQAQLEAAVVRANEDAQIRDKLEKAILELSERLQAVDAKRAALESSLTILKQSKEMADSELEREKLKVRELEPLTSQVVALHGEMDDLRLEIESLTAANKEQEETLVELGSHVSMEKLKLQEIDSQRKRASQQTWKSDSEAPECGSCHKKFGVRTRKHHCRNCGGIFCNECSDNKMPLPHSAKPVRVCDSCQRLLLQKMNP